MWLYVLKSKGDCFEKLKEFKGFVEMQSEHNIKKFRSDNSGVSVSKAFNQFLKDHGIEKQMSTPYTLQQNGVAERANCTIVEMTRNMLHARKLDKSFWAETVDNAVYTRNRCPTRALDSITPKEAWSDSCHALHICLYLDASPTQWSRMHKEVSSMQKTQNVCLWIIVRGLRPIGYCTYEPKKS